MRSAPSPLLLREPSGEAGAQALARYQEAGGNLDDPDVRAAVSLLGEHAPAFYPLCLGDLSLIGDVLRVPLSEGIHEAVAAGIFLSAIEGITDEAPLFAALRRTRHRQIVRIALREILRLADIDQTSQEMSAMASGATEAALRASMRAAAERYGHALDPAGRPVPLTVLGMGKLGGGELNLGSDIDLCFFYGSDEAELSASDRTVHEVYAKVASGASKALSEVTAEGFCFRVDLRLRPEGSRGPLVNSLASAERYYEAWGRTWERAALLRAQPIAGDRAFGAALLRALRPFIYRSSVEPQIAEEMAEMLRRSRRELKVDEERDIKLGRGGIREAEFFVQSLQLIWGGRHPELRVAGTVEALNRLESAGLVSARESQAHQRAWALLRNVEHRIHMRAGYQTHRVPDGEEGEAFARSLGFEAKEALDEALRQAREEIATLFASLTGSGEGEGGGAEGDPRSGDPQRALFVSLCDDVAEGIEAETLVERYADRLPFASPMLSASQLLRLGRRASAPLGPAGRARFPELGPLLLSELAEVPDPDTAVVHLADFFGGVGGREAYARLLTDQPRLTRRLLGLFGVSGTLSRALIGHPEELDLVLLAEPPEEGAIEREHRTLMIREAERAGAGEEPDPEAFLAELRRTLRRLRLQIGLAHLAGELPLLGATARLSRLAECQVRAALGAASRQMCLRYGEPSGEGPTEGLVVAALGKLGGGELGFGGDLDLIFLYGSDGETRPGARGRSTTHQELYTRIAQRTMALLSQPDAEGPGYQTDTRLRPSGSRGTLVVSLAAFDRYHEKGAQAWERQALIKARPIAGPAPLRAAIARRFAHLAFEQGAPPGEETARMRARLEEELGKEEPDRLHPKLGYGGLVDIEFLAQQLQMKHGADRRVRTPNTLEALARLVEVGALEPGGGHRAREAYLFFRRLEQSLKLLFPTREATLRPGGEGAARVARRLGLRARDAHDPEQVLLFSYRRHAREARSLFEAEVGEVGTSPPWGTEQDSKNGPKEA